MPRVIVVSVMPGLGAAASSVLPLPPPLSPREHPVASMATMPMPAMTEIARILVR